MTELTRETHTGELLKARLLILTAADPQLVQEIVSSFESTQSRFEWIKKKFDEKKYKSSEIYGRPRDPALVKEMEEYIKSRQAAK